MGSVFRVVFDENVVFESLESKEQRRNYGIVFVGDFKMAKLVNILREILYFKYLYRYSDNGYSLIG